MKADFKKTVLDNGVRVLTERHPFAQSISLGIWTTVGSRDESIDEHGAAHFLEHLVFKGTQTRSAFDIAAVMERVGGEINAFTTREETCYHVECLKDHLDLGVDVLSDILLNPIFNERDFELERSVILQEIAMYADSPEEHIYDLFYERVFPNSGLGRGILGTENSLAGFTVDKIKTYFKNNYTPDNWIVTAAGDIDHDELVEKINSTLGSYQSKTRELKRDPSQFSPFQAVVEKDCEQVHLLFGAPAPTYKDSTRFEMNVLSTLIGGGMTSRLYQLIREEKGLAYSVYGHLGQYTDTGLFNIYCGTDRSQAGEVYKLVKEELERIKKNGVTEEEVGHCKTQIRGGMLMASDDIDSRMHSIGICEIVFGEYRRLESILESLDKVTSQTVNEFISKWEVNSSLSSMVYGPISEKELQ